MRVWPAAVLGVLLVVLRLVPGVLEGGLSRYWMVAMIGTMLCSLLLVIWWLAASRATWKERVFGSFGLAGALALAVLLVEPMMRGPGTVYVTLPLGMTGFVLGAILW